MSPLPEITAEVTLAVPRRERVPASVAGTGDGWLDLLLQATPATPPSQLGQGGLFVEFVNDEGLCRLIGREAELGWLEGILARSLESNGQVVGVVGDAGVGKSRLCREFIERCRKFFAEFIPGLADARVCQTRLCFYNNTPDDDFIISIITRSVEVILAEGASFLSGYQSSQDLKNAIFTCKPILDIEGNRLFGPNNRSF